jgi:hypothetical protein
MKRKSPIIKQSVVTELTTQLTNLPDREKAPGDPVSLSEIFHAKKYVADIRGALKRGYSFDDLAQIFTEKCGVAVSARQIKYHFTRGKNQETKNKAVKKAGEIGGAESHISSTDSLRKSVTEDTKESVATTDLETKPSSKGVGFVFENGATICVEGNAKAGAFALDTKPKES